MNKALLIILIVSCVFTSCKTGVESEKVEQCELFKIGNFEFYNPRVYDYPIITKKGSHELLHNDFVPAWYAGYAAKNLPSFFKTKEAYLKYVNNSKIEKYTAAHFEGFYEKNKTNINGIDALNHKDFHLLFRGTVSVRHAKSGNEYLLVAGKSYLDNESDFDKNTEFYEGDVKTMFAFQLEDDVYKSVDIDRIVGQFGKAQHDKVFNILHVKNMMDLTCLANVNTMKNPNFSNSELPKWVYNKSEVN